MTERLTYWNDKEKKSALPKCINDFGDVVDLEDLCYKLACLEDILEKYGIESVEELDKKLANFDSFMKGNKFETIEDLQNALNGKFIEVFDEKNKIWQDMVKNLTKTEKDRDTWQKACELACDILMPKSEIKTIQLNDDNQIINSKEAIDYFYQQAKQFAGR